MSVVLPSDSPSPAPADHLTARDEDASAVLLAALRIAVLPVVLRAPASPQLEDPSMLRTGFRPPHHHPSLPCPLLSPSARRGCGPPSDPLQSRTHRPGSN